MKGIVLGLLLANANVSFAQVVKDSLAEDFRTLAAMNFSRYRTVNFSWETTANQDYSFGLGGNTQERGHKQAVHNLRFSTMVPIVKSHKASLYVNVQYNSYNFESKDDEPSQIFKNDTYDYYAGGLNGSYYAKLFNHPLILSADIFADAWKKGFGEVQGRFAAMVVLKKTYSTNFSFGLMGVTHFSSTPMMPIVTYWHRFRNPNLSIDITFPSQIYLRYQMHRQRLSVGTTMSADNFYLKSELEGRPLVYCYQEAVLKPEVHYEYIINRQFYISAHAGLSALVKGGLYTKKRKELKMENAENGNKECFFQSSRSAVPFFNVGVSYSLWRILKI